MNALLCLAALATFLPIALATGPDVVRGVNLGSLFGELCVFKGIPLADNVV